MAIYEKCCRSCHWFNDGQCLNKDNFNSNENKDVSEFYLLSEEGYVHEVLKETIQSEIIPNIKNLIDYLKLSQKAKNQFMSDIEELNDDWAYELDNKLVQLDLNNHSSNAVPIYIKNPDEFCCNKYF